MNFFLLLLQVTALLTSQAPGKQPNCAGMSGAAVPRTPPAFADAAEAAEQGDFAEAHQQFSLALLEFSADAEVLFFDGSRSDLPLVQRFTDKLSVCRGEGAGRKCEPAAMARRDVLSLKPELLRWGAYLSCRAGENDKGMTLLKMSWRDWADQTSVDDAALLRRAADKDPASENKGIEN